MLKQHLQALRTGEVSCDYAVNTNPHSHSPRSDIKQVPGLSPEPKTELQKPNISVHAPEDKNVALVCLINLKTPAVNTSCYLYVGDSSQPYRSAWTTNGRVCSFNVERADLQQHLQALRAGEVSCDYAVNTNPHSHSPRSDRKQVRGLSPEPKTDKKTTSPSPVTTKKKGVKPPSPPLVTTKKTLAASSTLTAGSATTPLSDGKVTPTTELRTKPPTEPRTEPHTEPRTELATGSRTELPTEPRTEAPAEPQVLLLGIGSAVGVVVLGVTAICLCKKLKLKRQTEPINNSLYASVTMENILSASDTCGTDRIYDEINDVPSSFKSPPVPSQNDTYSMITAVPAWSKPPVYDSVATVVNKAANDTPRSSSAEPTTEAPDTTTYSSLQMH
ncbi:mucin-2-like isoform X4 [Conger conger]|nr:mucin-2-like isoform X4 [Conger conger]XP_061091440.1 mucin-2-like isoform X4 [Conger conger]